MKLLGMSQSKLTWKLPLSKLLHLSSKSEHTSSFNASGCGANYGSSDVLTLSNINDDASVDTEEKSYEVEH